MELNEANIEKEIKENKLILIQFWAPWCGPCRALMPTIDKLIEDFEGKEVVIGKVNTDENQGLMPVHGIRGIPTVLLFKDGEEVERLRGGPLSMYTDKLNYYLNAITA
jgi:thioredoxin 1